MVGGGWGECGVVGVFFIGFMGGGGGVSRDCLHWHLLFNLRNFLFPAGSFSSSRVLQCVRRLGTFGFLWEKKTSV